MSCLFNPIVLAAEVNVGSRTECSFSFLPKKMYYFASKKVLLSKNNSCLLQ